MKSRFISELQGTLDNVPQNDDLVLLGNYNVKEGVLKPGEDEWQG